MTEFIKTDENIMINLLWVKEIKIVNDCYKLKIHIDNVSEYEVCKTNIESYNKLEQKFKFSKK